MKDIHKKLMKRSFKDAASIAEDIEEEYGIVIPQEAYPQMALHLYEHRVQKNRMNWYEAKHNAAYPDGSPDAGRY